MNNIKCPRCGSEQISANKKGWSLTTGLIGSNKIIITCLKCGKQFRPGQDMIAQQEKQRQKNEAMKSPTFWIFFVALMMLFIWAFKSCSSSSDSSNISSNEETAKSVPVEKPIPDSITKWYKVIYTQIDAVNHKYFLYIKDTTKIELVNNYLKSYYNPNNDQYLNIYYFNNEKASYNYFEKQMDDNISEKKKNALFKHFIATYYYNPSNSASGLDYPHR